MQLHTQHAGFDKTEYRKSVVSYDTIEESISATKRSKSRHTAAGRHHRVRRIVPESVPAA